MQVIEQPTEGCTCGFYTVTMSQVSFVISTFP